VKKIINLKNNKFLKNVLMISGSTALAQIINLLLTPVITRLYSPFEFGIITVYLSILGMVAIIGSFKFDLGIAIASDDKKAINVLALSFLVLIIFVGTVCIILALWGDFLFEVFSVKILEKYKYFIPLGIFLTGLYNIFTQWNIRKRIYNSISKTKINQSIIQNVIKISFGLINLGPLGLLIGSLMGQSAGITTLSASLVKKERNLLKEISFKKIIWCSKRYIRFPIFSAPSQFLNTAGLHLPVLFITTLYGSKATGYYGLANSIISIPIILIGLSVSDVFYGEAASIGKKDPKRLNDLINKLLRKLIIVALFLTVILVAFGPTLVTFVFGEQWYNSGVYARIISLLVFTRLVFTPFSRVFSIYERQKEELFLDIFRVLMVLMIFVLAKALTLNPYWFVSIYTLAMSVVYFVTFLVAKKIINDEVNKISLKAIS
jgi:O-antigen/teichoic acid export membrane protein